MASVGDTLNDDDFLGDAVDTPKKGTEQCKKLEELKSIIDKGKLGHKWADERVEVRDEVIKKRMLNTSSVNLTKKVKKLEKLWGSMLLIYTLLEFLNGLKSRMLKNHDRSLRMTQSLKIKWRI